MAHIFRQVARGSKLYNVDEYGIRNYKTRFLAIVGTLLISILAMLFGYITYLAEVDAPGANVTEYSQALWLMLMSCTTIGFGDHYPVTLIGKVMVVLMFVLGVGLIGGMGALFAGKLLGFTDTNVKNRELRQQNAEILRRLEHMDRELRHMRQKEKG